MVFSGVLAIALMLSAGIVTLARRFNKQDCSRTAAGWLDAYQQLRADLPEIADRRSEPMSRPNGSNLKKATPTDPACLKAGLQQLVRDLRRAEMLPAASLVQADLSSGRGAAAVRSPSGRSFHNLQRRAASSP
jgi:hypothetical protein